MRPRFIEPCLPKSAPRVPTGTEWVHDIKLDGYRMQVVKEGTGVGIYTRRGADWTKRLRFLADDLRQLKCCSAIIDAELVYQRADGAIDFRRLHFAFANRDFAGLALFAFDLLHRDGLDLRDLPLVERRRRLARLCTFSKLKHLQIVTPFDNGSDLLATAERLSLEGVVSKRKASLYRSGYSRDWLKIKTISWREANRGRGELFRRVPHR